MNRFALAALAVMTCAVQAAAAASLSSADTNLGRVKAAVLQEGLTVTIDLGDDIPTATHIIARFQNNQPLMRGRDGLWAPWAGDMTQLDEVTAVVADKKLIVRVLDAKPEALFYPASFTVVYRTETGVKSGTITVDGP
ncbi:MAG: hypothetical protein K2P94_09095 [Rhodospirillaceae bacterium]|nr:hypothetical protein [Rhodospirillaceae bacterium]